MKGVKRGAHAGQHHSLELALVQARGNVLQRLGRFQSCESVLQSLGLIQNIPKIFAFDHCEIFKHGVLPFD